YCAIGYAENSTHSQCSRRRIMKKPFIPSPMWFGRARAAPASAREVSSSASYAPAESCMRRAWAATALAAAGLLCAGLAGPAHAQLPPVETAQGIEYVSGGIGSDASTAFKAAKSSYPLALTFAAVGDDGSTPYVANVRLEITDGQGESVLSLPSVGPYLLAKLQPGTYTVRATYKGIAQTQQVNVGGPGSVDVRIAWKRPAVGPD